MHRPDPPPAPADARADLARRQAALVRALQGDAAPPPDGFEPAHLGRAAESLARKRARSVRKTWPAVAASFGAGFDGQFQAYTSGHPLPSPPHDDGIHFVRWLAGRGLLDDAGRIELAAATAARGFPVKLVFLENMPRIALVYRWAGAVHILSPRRARRP